MKIRFSSLIVLFSVLLIGVEAAQAQLVISEILAVNDTVVQDEDGDYSDFLEVFNAGPTAVNLGGYYLTDDALELTKWEIPDMVLPSGGFALFFCSDKDRIDPSAELHTNFKLLSTGEYLAIVDPDGQTPVFEFDPYPPQVADFSYGLRMNGEEIRFVRERDDCTALVPSNGNLGLTWTAWDFNDNSWESGETGVGYDRNSDYDSNIRLDIQNEMEDENTTTYIRVPFEVDDASGVGSFTLRMKYDDGFIAYLNGDRVASANAPGAASWNSTATTLHDDGEAVQFVDFPFSSNALRNGTNVLAIHGLNDNLGSSDFLISPELRGQVAGELQLDVREYQPSPTPGGANVGGFPGIAETPVFSTPGSVFTGSVSLRLTTTSPESVIRYTTDGSEPNESDSIANGAINITNTTLVRARSFREDYSPSPIVTQGYVELASSAANFSSNLPIVVIENFDEGEPGTSRFEPAFMAIFMPGQDGRTRFDQPPVLQTRIGIKRRGSSTAGQPKGQYAIEAWDEKGEDTNIEPFGLPREADWILYGGNTYDRAIIRNKFIFDTSNALGTYAPRSELVEIFFNTGGGSVSSGDNVGVYAFGEKIERDNNRVDVERLTASIDSLPEIAGGYMFKIDRLDPGDGGFNAGGRRLGWVYPKEEFATSAHESWISNHINQFISALNGGNFRHPELGYQRFIDRDLWIDHHILNVMAMNVDALRLSTYFHKARDGKIIAGPVWDFDRSMGSTDGRDDNPRAWNGTGDGTRFFDYPWWERLFDDPDFWQLWIDRWQTQRAIRGELSTSAINARIDFMAQYLSEAGARNNSRWGWSSFPGRVNEMKNWLSSRTSWIDSQFESPPRLGRSSREIEPGFELSINGGTIYYTLDGSDPRAVGGGIAPGAERYTETLVLDDNAKVVARTRSGNDWSGPVSGSYWVTRPRLVITEMMYHPPRPLGDGDFGADDFEFIELLNTGNDPLDLENFEFTGGVELTFGPGATLDPGEYGVVVENRAAFEARYGVGINIVGDYRGNLANGGETVTLMGPLGEPILDFEFDDTWYPDTDGGGLSLVFVDPFIDLDSWGVEENWTESSVLLGTPGTDDDGVGSLGGRQFPGDSNQDGFVDISDALNLLIRLFGGGAGELPCEGAIDEGGNLTLLDVDGDADVGVTDAILLVNWLFRNGDAPVQGTRCIRIEGCPSACGI